MHAVSPMENIKPRNCNQNTFNFLAYKFMLSILLETLQFSSCCTSEMPPIKALLVLCCFKICVLLLLFWSLNGTLLLFPWCYRTSRREIFLQFRMPSTIIQKASTGKKFSLDPSLMWWKSSDFPFGWQKSGDKIRVCLLQTVCPCSTGDSGLGVFWVDCPLIKGSNSACKYSKSRKSRAKDLNTRDGEWFERRREDLWTSFIGNSYSLIRRNRKKAVSSPTRILHRLLVVHFLATLCIYVIKNPEILLDPFKQQ